MKEGGQLGGRRGEAGDDELAKARPPSSRFGTVRGDELTSMRPTLRYVSFRRRGHGSLRWRGSRGGREVKEEEVGKEAVG